MESFNERRLASGLHCFGTCQVDAKQITMFPLIHKHTIKSIPSILFGIPAQAHQHTDQYPLAEQQLLIIFPIGRGHLKDT